MQGVNDGKFTIGDASQTRSIACRQLCGIQFAPPCSEPSMTFRPCTGFPVDELRAKLVRW
jgi:hypothetical protein